MFRNNQLEGNWGLQGNWTINCKKDGLCGGGTRGQGNLCDTRDYKKGQPDYCGKCKYGWRLPVGSWNDWCCSWNDFIRAKDCKCEAKFAPECLSNSGKN